MLCIFIITAFLSFCLHAMEQPFLGELSGTTKNTVKLFEVEDDSHILGDITLDLSHSESYLNQMDNQQYSININTVANPVQKKCPKCDFLYTKLKIQEEHYKTHGVSSCCICGEYSASKIHLEKLHHDSYIEKYIYPCLINDCAKRFLRPVDLRQHTSQVHNIEEKKRNSRAFMHNFNAEEKIKECPVCKKTMFRLKPHLKIAHIDYYQENYKLVCPGCQQRYKEQSDLDIHQKFCPQIQAQHDITQDQNPSKKKCKFN